MSRRRHNEFRDRQPTEAEIAEQDIVDQFSHVIYAYQARLSRKADGCGRPNCINDSADLTAWIFNLGSYRLPEEKRGRIKVRHYPSRTPRQEDTDIRNWVIGSDDFDDDGWDDDSSDFGLIPTR